MKNILTFACLLFLTSTTIFAQDKTEEISDSTKVLIGEWTIDLRPTPESTEYFQPFVVDLIEGNTFKGTFYGSNLENALLNKNWDKLYFSFTTKDSSNEYYHSGYLVNGKIFGISYCPNRNFTAPWTGEKVKKNN
jgi:hypothetical protein